MLKGVFGRDPDSGVGSEQVLDEVFGFTRELPQSRRTGQDQGKNKTHEKYNRPPERETGLKPDQSRV